MKKRVICLLVLAGIVCSFLCACASKENITAEQAVTVMLEDLGEDAAKAVNPHVHENTFNNEHVYNIYFTLDGESWVYVISVEGEIMAKGPGGHSH